jgi:hypothetical protein
MSKSQQLKDGPAVNEKDNGNPDSGRDARGRFQKGNAGGPGNPFARRVAELRKVMLELVTDDELRIIVGQLMVMAKMGDLAAIKLVLQYSLGKPAATVDPDTVDLQEMELLERSPDTQVLSDMLLKKLPAEMTATFCRGALPVMGQIKMEAIAQSLQNGGPPPDPEQEYADKIQRLLDDDSVDDSEIDEDEDEDEDEEELQRRERQDGAPSSNGNLSAAGRQTATRPMANRDDGKVDGREKRDNGRPGPKSDGRNFTPRPPSD